MITLFYRNIRGDENSPWWPKQFSSENDAFLWIKEKYQYSIKEAKICSGVSKNPDDGVLVKNFYCFCGHKFFACLYEGIQCPVCKRVLFHRKMK